MLNFIVFLNFAINIYIGLIFFRVILSWIRVDFEGNFFFRFIFELTEPMLAPFRKIGSAGFLDFSPLIAIILLELIKRALSLLV